MKDQSFTFEDFLDQLDQLKNMGPLDNMLSMIPGVNKKALKGIDLDEKQFDRTKAIILSMTVKERQNPQIINYSRKQRIANGSGTTLQEVNGLLKQFEQMKKMMKQFSKKKMPRGMKGFF